MQTLDFLNALHVLELHPILLTLSYLFIDIGVLLYIVVVFLPVASCSTFHVSLLKHITPRNITPYYTNRLIKFLQYIMILFFGALQLIIIASDRQLAVSAICEGGICHKW